MQAKSEFTLDDGRDVLGFGLETRVKQLDISANAYEVRITTEAADRDGDIVVAAGGVIEPYLKNPVVLYGHNYRAQPVARTLSLTIEPGAGIVAQFEFPPFGTSAQADEVHGLWRAGFLNAASIGFMPLTWVNLETDHDTWFPPRKFTEWELFEWSIVTVPANREALRRAVKGLGLDWTNDADRERNVSDVGFWNAVGEYVTVANSFMQLMAARRSHTATRIYLE